MAETNVEEVLGRYPNNFIDRDSFAMYEGFLEGRLLINRCQECQKYFQPPWPSCPNCWSENIQPTEVSGRGEIFTFVILHVGALPGVDYMKGHPLVVVQLEEQDGLRVTGTMVNCANEDIRIGMPVTLNWVERNGAPVPAFQPA